MILKSAFGEHHSTLLPPCALQREGRADLPSELIGGLFAVSTMKMVRLKLRSKGSKLAPLEKRGDLKSFLLPVIRREIQVSVDVDLLKSIPYFQKLFQRDWQNCDEILVLDFPAVRMLDGFWIALRNALGESVEKLMRELSPGICIQTFTAAHLLGLDDLLAATEDYIVEHMSPILFISAFDTCEKCYRNSFKRKLFRYLLVSQFVVVHGSDNVESNLVVSRDGKYLSYHHRKIATALFYDVLKEEIREKRILFLPVSELQLCYVERIREMGIHGDETHFIVRKESDNQVVLAASHTAGTGDFILSNKYPCTFRNNSLDFIGTLESNFLGTVFTINDHGVYFDDAAAIMFPELIRGEHGAVIYDSNILARVPNAMTIVLPSTHHQLEHSDSIVTRYNSGLTQEMMVLRSQQPEWNEYLEAWTLDFHGRARMASKKNFKVRDGSDWLLLFGKRKKHIYSLDFKHPLSPVQALSIALSSFADKLMAV